MMKTCNGLRNHGLQLTVVAGIAGENKTIGVILADDQLLQIFKQLCVLPTAEGKLIAGGCKTDGDGTPDPS